MASTMRRDLISRYQIIITTGISADYFNNLLNVVEPKRLNRPEDYYRGGEMELRKRLVETTQALISYTEMLTRAVDRYNRTNRRHGWEEIEVSILVVDGARPAVNRLDAIALEINSLGRVEPAEIDLGRLRTLLFEAAVIIYGKRSRESLKERFGIQGD